MAVPKRKLSRSRTRRRKAQWLKMSKPTNASCARCKTPIRPHTVCGTCGFYAGKQVVEVD
ncbi:MAG: 50S ribosomal protein L32 [Actinomycetes bacterium]|jgi:large subunit ribosomal protein L32